MDINENINNIEEKTDEIIEPADVVTDKTTIEFEQQPSAKSFTQKAEKPITRKFLSIALAIAVLVNTGLTAGVTALFNNSKDSGKAKFNTEQNIDNNKAPNTKNHSKKTPPSKNDQQNQENTEQIIQQDKASIGIMIADNNGVYIAQVTGGNAKTAGFQEGDKIVSFEGSNISTSDELVSAVQQHNVGDNVSVIVERNSQQMEIKTVLE